MQCIKSDTDNTSMYFHVIDNDKVSESHLNLEVQPFTPE